MRKADETQPLHERIDYLGQLRSQAEVGASLVLFASSGSRPVAAAVDAPALPLPFVVRDKTYWASFASQAEADFLGAFLNSDFVAERIEDWQTRGLFGARDVHKRPLDVPWPPFDPSNPDHQALASAGARLRIQATVAAAAPSTRGVGAQRVWMRTQLVPVDLAEVERLVSAISAARTAALAGNVRTGTVATSGGNRDT